MNITESIRVSYNDLFTEFYPRLCVYSESFVSDSLVAEDLVQDVFVNVWMKRSKLSLDGSLSSYLYRAVHNACIQYLRHQQVAGYNNIQIEARLTEAELIPFSWMNMTHDPAEKNEIYTLYKKAIGLLPEKTREIFLLSREQGLKNSEIAEKVGLSVKTIEYHISKALEIFRNIFKDYIWILLLLGGFRN